MRRGIFPLVQRLSCSRPRSGKVPTARRLACCGLQESRIRVQFFGGITRERDSAKTADFMLNIDQVLCARREHPCFTGAGACKNGNVPRRCDSSRLKRIEFQSAIVLSGFQPAFSGALLSFIFSAAAASGSELVVGALQSRYSSATGQRLCPHADPQHRVRPRAERTPARVHQCANTVDHADDLAFGFEWDLAAMTVRHKAHVPHLVDQSAQLVQLLQQCGS